MIKKLLISILMILSLALGVSAGDIIVTPTSSTTFTANVSDVISGNFTVQNTNTTDSLTVSLPSTIDFIGTTANQTGVSVTYNVTSLYPVANLTNESIKYDITVPANAKNEAYTGVLNMTAGAENYDTLTLTLNVNPAPAMTISNAAVTVAEDNSNTGSFTITNTGNSDLSVTLTPTDLTGSTQNISSSNIALDPTSPVSVAYGESKDINVTVTAPANSSSSTAYEGKIVADYAGNQINSTLSVTVQPVNELIKITQSIAQAVIVKDSSQDATTSFKIKNDGNVVLSPVSFTPSDLVMDANNSISSSYITVNPTSLAVGEEKEITISISELSYAVGT